jgi:small subunit ribosomal protein S35
MLNKNLGQYLKTIQRLFAKRLNYYSTTELKTDQNSDSGSKEREFIHSDDRKYDPDGFQIFDPYMKKQGRGVMFARNQRSKRAKTTQDVFARANSMSVDQDWTQAWPTYSMFKQSAVPLPLRQGFVKNLAENEGLPPEKYANCELIKIPNFFHLTPPHIKKHCDAIKKFCTAWPEELNDEATQIEHFPLEITSSSYIYDGPNIRDDRARTVTLEFPLVSLEFKEERSKKKIIKLAQHRYDPQTDSIKISTSRLPYRRQNEDYVMYLLTTLYYEAKQFEEWENEAEESDKLEYTWTKKNKSSTKTDQAGQNNNKTNTNDTYQDRRTDILTNETNAAIRSYKEVVKTMLKI